AGNRITLQRDARYLARYGCYLERRKRIERDSPAGTYNCHLITEWRPSNSKAWGQRAQVIVLIPAFGMLKGDKPGIIDDRPIRHINPPAGFCGRHIDFPPQAVIDH